MRMAAVQCASLGYRGCCKSAAIRLYTWLAVKCYHPIRF